MSKRVLIVFPSAAIPSSHVSGMQYIPLFRENGFDVRAMGISDVPTTSRDRTLTRLARKARLHAVAEGIGNRAKERWENEILEEAAAADVVYAIKVPSLSFHEKVKGLGRPRLLVGFGDAFWLPRARTWGWNDLESILRISDGVTCINDFTADFVRRHNEAVFVVPDCPQVEDFDKRRDGIRRDSSRITLGWVGTVATAGTLFRIFEPLESLFTERDDLHLRIVGAGDGLHNIPPFEKVRWSGQPGYDQQVMVDEVLRMDIGLFPQFRGDDALARGSLKSMVYMSGGAATIAQDFGDNRDLIQDGENGLLADSEDSWLEAMRRLASDANLRRTLAANGLATVRQRYSRRACFESLRRAVESVQ